MKSSRKEVALLAGVSEATVSRVFNNPDKVSPGKVEKVRSSAEQLGYQPDKFASALRRRGTGRLIFLEYRGEGDYQWPEIRIFNWLYADILRAVVESVGRTSFHLELRTVGRLEEIRSMGRDCDGLLAFNVEERSYAEAVAAAGVPYICAHHTEGLEGFSRCSTDNFRGGQILGAALKQRGTRSAAYITGHLHQVEAHRRRWAGFKEGFKGDVELIEGVVGIEGGKRAAEQLAGAVRRREITALCGVNDLTALGLIRGLNEQGIRIPEECLVTGYDNLPVGLSFSFSLPTVDLRLGLLYRKAVEGLLRFIREGLTAYISVDPVLVPGTLLDPSNPAP